MRVLHVVAVDTMGGTETTVASQSERMRTRGVDVEVAFLSRSGMVSDRLRRSGVPARALGPGPLRAGRRLRRLMAGGDYDVVNAYGFKAATIARIAALGLSRRPAFVHGVHGLHITEVVRLGEAKGRFAFAVERRLEPLVDLYEVISRGAIELMVENGLSRSRIRYVPNAVDSSVWQGIRSRREYDGPPVALCVARFVARKRQADIITAVHLLGQRGVGVEARFVGEGELYDECRELARELGVEARCEFLGSVAHSDLPAVVESAQIFVIASVWEGMSGAVLEAMASGLPVVGTRVNGVSDLFVDGESGLAVSVRDPAALADALQRLATDPALRRRLGTAAAERIDEYHDLERLVDAKLALYGEAMTLAGRRAAPRLWSGR